MGRRGIWAERRRRFGICVRLLHKEVDFTVILTHPSWRRNKQVMGFLKELNIPHCMVKDLPRRVSGVFLWGLVQGRLGKEDGLECLAIVDDGEGFAAQIDFCVLLVAFFDLRLVRDGRGWHINGFCFQAVGLCCTGKGQ